MPRRGFTLVEMLMSVAVMLLLMFMFAQVFQLAGNTITMQRGIAENDQRSRTMETIIRSDLEKRSFRYVMPWQVGEDPGLPEVNGVLRKGYLYISENDPASDVDDLLQFTIDVNITRKNSDTSKIYGRAIALGQLTLHPNQPEADDGASEPDGSSQSSAAEVAYFVRDGKLYRRTLLLREKLPLDGTTTQPTFHDVNTGKDRDMFNVNLAGSPAAYPVTGVMIPGPSTFWNEFDNSAYYFAPPPPNPGDPPLTPWANFHGVEDMANNKATYFSLGKPNYRFGHRIDTGRSREFDVNGSYFGRYTHEETSNTNFRYPQGLSTIGGGTDPMSSMNSAYAMNASDSVFNAFRNGPRRGEDLLLSNVHSFDVKIWDDSIRAFVDVGGATNAGQNSVDYYTPVNSFYGPNTGSPPVGNRVFDTWFPYAPASAIPPDVQMDLNSDSANDPPPFRLMKKYPPSYGMPASQTIPVWSANQIPNIGDLWFPNARQRANGFRYSYRCVQSVGSGQTGLAASGEPNTWPSVIGGRVIDGITTTNPATGVSTLVDGVLWEAVDNWKPLTAIQITVRFQDSTSQQIRQLTINHSFVD